MMNIRIEEQTSIEGEFLYDLRMGQVGREEKRAVAELCRWLLRWNEGRHKSWKPGVRLTG